MGTWPGIFRSQSLGCLDQNLQAESFKALIVRIAWWAFGEQRDAGRKLQSLVGCRHQGLWVGRPWSVGRVLVVPYLTGEVSGLQG